MELTYDSNFPAGGLPSHAFKARYGLLCIAVSFSFAAIPPLLSWITANLRSTGAMTLAVPLNVSIGQIGQIIGTSPQRLPCTTKLTRDLPAGVYIFKANEAPGYPTGHFTNAAFLILGAAAVLVLRFIYKQRNSALGPEERRWRL